MRISVGLGENIAAYSGFIGQQYLGIKKHFRKRTSAGERYCHTHTKITYKLPDQGLSKQEYILSHYQVYNLQEISTLHTA